MTCMTCNAATDLYHCHACTDETRALTRSLTHGPGTTPGSNLLPVTFSSGLWS